MPRSLAAHGNGCCRPVAPGRGGCLPFDGARPASGALGSEGPGCVEQQIRRAAAAFHRPHAGGGRICLPAMPVLPSMWSRITRPCAFP